MSIIKDQFIKPLVREGANRLGCHRLPSLNPKLWILMYHRVLPVSDSRFQHEEPGMVITPEIFDAHMKQIKKYFQVVSLESWLQKKNSGDPLPAKSCVVTFDDGWLDNYEYAFPILKKHNVPATVFAVSHMIGTDRRFWPNRLMSLFSNLYAHDKTLLADALSWVPGFDNVMDGSETHRERLFHLVNNCKQLTDLCISEHLDGMGLDNYMLSDKPDLMDWDQLQEMSGSLLIDVGSHTCDHVSLNKDLSDILLYEQIVSSKKMLSDILEKDISLFCYPNGDYTNRASELVAQHYSGAVTTRHGINKVDEDIYHLRRIGVHEDISDTDIKFSSRLSGWL